MIHLDTGFLIRALVRDSEESVTLLAWLGTGESVRVSTIAWTEFLCGPVEADAFEKAERVLGERVPFEDEDATIAARLFNGAGRRRGSLIDCMIAASAIRGRAALATSNPRDFLPFRAAGLEVVS